MAVLAREIDAYQRALDRYNQGVKTYNNQATAYTGQVNAYNNTLVQDGSGRAYVRDSSGGVYVAGSDGRLTPAVLPDGRRLSDYGATTLEGSYSLIRQNPTVRKTETVNNATLANIGDDGAPRYNMFVNGNYQVSGPEWKSVGVEWTGDGYAYILQRDASTYMDRPGAFTGVQPNLTAKAPDPTKAQLRSLQGDALAAERGGLINDTIQNSRQVF